MGNADCKVCGRRFHRDMSDRHDVCQQCINTGRYEARRINNKDEDR